MLYLSHMATLKQKRLAKELLNNAVLDKPNTAGAMLEKVGYSKHLAKQPGRVLEAKGVKDALAEYGLTDELITTALVTDIKAKPKNRLGELRLGAELLGKLKGDEEPKGNTINIYIAEQRERIARRVLARQSGSEESFDRFPHSDESEV